MKDKTDTNGKLFQWKKGMDNERYTEHLNSLTNQNYSNGWINSFASCNLLFSVSLFSVTLQYLWNLTWKYKVSLLVRIKKMIMQQALDESSYWMACVLQMFPWIHSCKLCVISLNQSQLLSTEKYDLWILNKEFYRARAYGMYCVYTDKILHKFWTHWQTIQTDE